LEPSVSNLEAIAYSSFAPIVKTNFNLVAMSELVTYDGDDIALTVDEEIKIDPDFILDVSEAIPSATTSSPQANVKNLVSAYSALHTKSTPIVPTAMKSLRPSYKFTHSVTTYSTHAAHTTPTVAVRDVDPIVIPCPVETAATKCLSLFLRTTTAETDDDKKKRMKDDEEDKDKVERKEQIVSAAQHFRSIVSRFEEPQAKATTTEVTEIEVNASRVRALILENEQKIREKKAALEILNMKPSCSKPMKIRPVHVSVPALNLGATSRWKAKNTVMPIATPIPSTYTTPINTHRSDMDTETVETQDIEDDSTSTEETDEGSDTSVLSKASPADTTMFLKALPSDTSVFSLTLPSETSVFSKALPSDNSVFLKTLPSDTSVFSKALPSAVDVPYKTVAPSSVLPQASPVRISSTTASHIVPPLNKTPSSPSIKVNNWSPIDKSTIKFTVPSHIVPKLVFPPSANRLSMNVSKRLSVGKA
jgi:hypothetical protein